MKYQETKLDEGMVFLVPLPKDSYSLGVLARIGVSEKYETVLFGYFFGSRLTKLPTSDFVQKLTWGERIFECRFVDLGFRNGKWKIIDTLSDWKREDWPFPDFQNLDFATGQLRKAVYDENEIDGLPIFEPFNTTDNAEDFPKDGIYGSVAVETVLDHILD